MRTWLAKARKQKKLTHQKVADLAGIKRQYYGMIENGERTPSVGTAKKIAEILDIDWTLFFDDLGNKTLLKINTA
jgi:putative transcriptional regulator